MARGRGDRATRGVAAAVTGFDRHGRAVTVTAGDRVRWTHADGTTETDVVRAGFWAHHLLAPYAPNYAEPAVVLTKFSWVPLKWVEVVHG